MGIVIWTPMLPGSLLTVSLYTERHHRAVLTDKRPDEEPARSYLEAIEDSLKRSQTLTFSFLAVSFYDCKKHTFVM